MIRVKNPNYVDRLSDEYQEVEYLESTGTQYIDTGIAPFNIDKITGEFQYTNTSDNQGLFGGRYSSNNTTIQGVLSESSNVINFKWFDQLAGITMDTNKHIFELSNKNIKIDNIIKLEYDLGLSADTSTLVLFARRADNSGEGIANCSKVKIYNFQIYNNILVRNFIPCYRKSDNIPGLYDLVNNQFYTNAGTGAFLVGKDVNKKDVNIKPGLREKNIFLPNEYQGLEYLHSTDAQQYIDTNFYATSEHVKYETKVLVQANTAYQALWGQYRSDSTSMIINAYTPSAGVLRFYAGATEGMTNTDFTISSNTDYEIVCEANNGTFTRTINGNTVTSTYLGNLNKQDAPILFAQRESVANEIRSYSGSRFYYFKIYDNNKLVCSFVPCYRKSDNVKGMYDMVRQTFHPFEGTGAVAIGAEKEHESIKIQNFLSQRYIGGKLVYGEPLVDYEYRWVTVGASGNSAYSEDGETWTAMSGLDNATYYGVAYCKDRFICVGTGGRLAYSTDGETWISMNTFTTKELRSIAYGNNRFVVVGSGTSFYSTDGETWVSMSGLNTNHIYNSVIYNNDRFVTVSSSGASFYSIDGETWISMSGLTDDGYYDIAYGDDRFICVGDNGRAYYSTDNLTWTSMSAFTSNNLRGIAYGNNKFVTVGLFGTTAYSLDGQTTSWIFANSSGLNTSTRYYGIAYQNGKFITIGENGKSHYSLDGRTWVGMTGLASAEYRAVCCGRKAIPKYSQLVNYTMLYDSGDECIDVTGGWEIFQNKTDSSVTVNKNSDSIYLARPNLGVSYSPEGGVRTINEIDSANYIKCGILARDYTSKNVVPKFFIEQSSGTAENLLFAISYHTQTCPYHTSNFSGKKMFLVDLIVKNSTKFCMRCMGGNQGTASVYFLNLVLYKQDDWQELCSIAGLTANSYTSESALCSDSTAINTILNNEDAVKFMIYNCTGTFMATAVLSSAFLTALNNSPYNTIIQANKHWNKFLAMVA